MTDKYAVIVAGGKGTRAGGGVPKQFREVAGYPMIWWSLKAFYEEDNDVKIVLVLPADAISYWHSIERNLPTSIPHICVVGGASRTESVCAGLAALPVGEDAMVAVHDAARPMVTIDLIRRGWQAAREVGAAVPVVPIADSLRKLLPGRNESVDRSEFVAVQTPQVFSLKILKEAYNSKEDDTFSDDASVVEKWGVSPVLFDGDSDNFKVTNPGDFKRAEDLLLQREHA